MKLANEEINSTVLENIETGENMLKKKILEWLNKEEEVNVFNLFSTLGYMFKLKRKENKTPSEKMALAGFKKLWKIHFEYVLFMSMIIVVITAVMGSFWARHDKYGGHDVGKTNGHVYEDESGELKIWYIRNIRHDISVSDLKLDTENLSVGDNVTMYVKEDGSVMGVVTNEELKMNITALFIVFGIIGVLIIILVIIVVYKRKLNTPEEKAWGQYCAWEFKRRKDLLKKGIYNNELPDWHGDDA